MTQVARRTFSLTEEQARYIDGKVESGDFASGSEVIRAGLRAMQERDAAMQRWLREEVLPVMRRVEAGTEELIPAEKVWETIEAEIAKVQRQRGT
jgi:antitoxin ParD1/3/4